MAERNVSLAPLYIIAGSIAYLISGFDAAAWTIVWIAGVLFVLGLFTAISNRRKP